MPTDSLLPGRFVAAAMSPPHFPGHEDMPATVFQPNLNMADILYILTSIGFFALMIAFIWGCEKV